MDRILGFVGCLLTLVFISACALTTPEPQWREPAVVPAGWAADYDHVSGLRQYLRGQHDRARWEGATAYLYIYDDSNEHCVNIRKLMERDMIAAAFRDARITMLSYRRLKWLYARTPSVAFDPGNIEGIIVKMTDDGGLSDDAIFYAHTCTTGSGWSTSVTPTRSSHTDRICRRFAGILYC